MTDYDPDNPRKGFAAPAAKFFGRHSGQSLGDFAAELGSLTDDDVRDLHSGLANGTHTY